MGKSDWLSLASQAMVIVSPVFLAILGWIATELARWINAHVRDVRLRSAFLRLDDAVLVAVQETEKVLVEALREANVDGKLTAEEAEAAKSAALRALYSHLGQRGAAEIQRLLGLDDLGLSKFLAGKVEATLHSIQA